ncbi:MAG: energy-coupling factor ABC transporter permease, partial [Arenicellales bacterium]
VPIAVTFLVYQLARRWLPRHFFVYIFICCFLAGALAMLASRLAGMATLLAGPDYTLFQLQANGYFIMLIITMFPEAFINGAVMTMLVVFRPHWVGSFRDQHYLQGK